MIVAGNFTAQGMILQSPRGFNWAMFPLLKGKTQEQVANPQTYSISAQSTNKQSAMFVLAYLLNKQNLAKLDEMARASFKRALDDMKELATLAAKSQADAFNVVRERINDNVEQVSKLLKRWGDGE